MLSTVLHTQSSDIYIYSMMIFYSDKWQDFEDLDVKMTMMHIMIMMMLYTWYIHQWWCVHHDDYDEAQPSEYEQW